MRVLKTFLKTLFWGGAVFLILIYAVPLPERINKDYSTVITDKNREILRVYLTKDEKRRIFCPIEKMSPLFVKTAIIYEDKHFYLHPGVNPFSVFRALMQNIKHRKIVSGASTIPMQLARIVEPKPRTLKSKIIEAFRAIQFVLRLGRKKTLGLYLNLAPYGGNIEGVAAASMAYYGKTPDKLLPGEVAFLVSLPQSPSTRMPYAKKRKDARDSVLKRMLKEKLITLQQYKQAFEIPPPARIRKSPFKAPHFCNFVKAKHPNKRELHTSLDYQLQKKAENILKSYSNYIYSNGATNASVIIIENKTGKVKAAVGSLNYFDSEHSGQIAGFNAYRSSGSTLKPFLYALAIEKGIINPESLIEDAPYNLNGFSPKNFTLKWHGLVKAEEALSLSLNMPFAILLKKTGYDNFTNLLKKTGIKGPLNWNDYGLAIITGGMDVKLIDLTNLYSSLARGGYAMPYSLLENEKFEQKKILRHGSVYLTLRALSKRNRPDAPSLALFTIPSGKIYWKTGTSWGRRDSWSVGFKNKYTVGVWVGNFDGKGSKGIVGSELAAPVMFDIIRAIERNSKDLEWKYKGENDLAKIKVCSFSGYRANENCPSKKEVYVVRGTITIGYCPYHKRFLLEKKTGKRACPDKEYKRGELEFKVLTVYPPLVSQILKNGKTPSYPENCGALSEGKTMRIVSPLHQSQYFASELNEQGTITLHGVTSYGKKIYWFIDDKFVAETESGESKTVTLSKGKHTVLAQNEKGDTAKSVIKIR